MIPRIKKFLFKNSTDKQTIIKNTLWLSVGEVGSRILKLALFIYAARLLGVTEWGVFSYGLALMGIFSILSDVGINAVLVKEVSLKNENIKKYIATSFVLKLLLLFISATLLLLVTLFTKNNDIQAIIPLVALLLILDSIREFGFSLNRAREKMEYEAIIKLSSSIILVGLSLVFIFNTPSASSLLHAYIIAGVLGLFLLYKTIKKDIPNIFTNYTPKLIKTIFKEAWPVGMVAILGIALYNIDTILLEYFINVTEVGYYSAAQKIVQILWLVPSLFATALLPTLSRTIENKFSFSMFLGKSITTSLLLISLITIILVIFAKPIFTLLYGAEFTPAIPIFQITAFSAIAIIPSLFISNAFLAKGKQKITLTYISIAASLNVILCLILIPKYGTHGAAISYTVAQIISNIFIIYKAKKDPETNFSFKLPSINNLRSFNKSL